MRWCTMCHRRTYWEKTASSEFEAETESDERGERTERGWWGVRAEDRSRGLIEDGATDEEREEDAIPADD